MGSRRAVWLALALGVTIAAALLALRMSYWVPFEPNAQEFEAAAHYALASAHSNAEWVEVGLPVKFVWLTKGYKPAVFVFHGHRFVFFPQRNQAPGDLGGYFYSVDGTSPAAALGRDAQVRRLTPRWWVGRVSQRLRTGG